jgi:predicted ATP-grasp superfamily ATP-dependent carboligase
MGVSRKSAGAAVARRRLFEYNREDREKGLLHYLWMRRTKIMQAALELWEEPNAGDSYMLAGWSQWADAGSISSELPDYVIQKTGARKIAQIRPHGFYFFQAPGTHHYLRPVVKLEGGYRQAMETKKNEFYCAESAGKRLVIFKGEEPHMDIERYADAFCDAVQALGVRRVVMVGGVFGATPYDKDRQVSCVYSLPHMKAELEKYAVSFSDYEGGVTIGTYLAHYAESRGIEAVAFYAFVPAYDFSESSPHNQGLRLDTDYRAWWEMMRRVNHMFDLGLSFSDLRNQSDELTSQVQAKLEELARTSPQLQVRAYMAKVAEQFVENSFMPLDDVWERELGDLFSRNDE